MINDFKSFELVIEFELEFELELELEKCI